MKTTRQPLHKRVRVAYGKPGRVEVWSYPGTHEREVHVEILTKEGETIQVVVVLPR